MVNGPFSTCTGSLYLGFERGDALVQLLDRQGIEILLRQLAEQVVLAAGEILVEFHRSAASRDAALMSIRPAPIRE